MAKKKTKTSKSKNSIQRKRKYNSDMPKKLIDHMASGLSMRSFCGAINIHHSTLYEWLEKHEEFSRARDIGLAKAMLFWEKMGILLADGSLRGSAKIWEINMYNRFYEDWKRDKVEKKEENNNDFTFNFKYLPEALKKGDKNDK